MDQVDGIVNNVGEISGTIESKEIIEGYISTDENIEGNIMYTILKGLSAYEIAVKHGYPGTEEEWLDDLVGHVNRIDDADISSLFHKYNNGGETS